MKEPGEIYVKKYCGPCPHNGDWVTAWETVKANEAEIESLKRQLADCEQERGTALDWAAINKRQADELEQERDRLREALLYAREVLDPVAFPTLYPAICDALGQSLQPQEPCPSCQKQDRWES